ncbi:hypothetical protein Q8F55_007121 [Vanrija albida]|uniref:Flavin reductase like domain-containing protein n=1 Tax=Vanrija albida TaxID=181172 RepID=A0ABR3PZY6_9TREE
MAIASASTGATLAALRRGAYAGATPCRVCRASSSSSRAISTAPPSRQHAAAPRPRPRPLPSEADVGAKMRAVLRNVAQPVVVAVARTQPGSSSAYHGATLTSFASLTLEPHPLVAFSLRLPSRMADLLRESGQACTVAVSLLARDNQHIADSLARPGTEQAALFAQPDWDGADPPALRAAVGSLTCEVVRSVPLRDVGGQTAPSDPHGSELFICRVLDAADGEGTDSLVHYQREYHAVSRGGGRRDLGNSIAW